MNHKGKGDVIFSQGFNEQKAMITHGEVDTFLILSPGEDGNKLLIPIVVHSVFFTSIQEFGYAAIPVGVLWGKKNISPYRERNSYSQTLIIFFELCSSCNFLMKQDVSEVTSASVFRKERT